MQKPNNYDETKVGGQYTPISTGGHHMIIKQVSETKSSTGKPQIVVLMDTAKNDSQPGFFSKEFADDIRPGKEKSGPIPDLSGLTQKTRTAIVPGCSNPSSRLLRNPNNCEAIWGDGFAKQFKK